MSTSRTRRIDEIGDESRRRILDAAEELFAEKGFDRTSFVDIAERSGISRGSIPWHFQNKDGLLIAVVERAIQRYIPDDSLISFDQEGMREVIGRVRDWVKHPTAVMIYMVLTEAMANDGPLHESYVDFFRDRRKGIYLLLAATRGRPGRPTEEERKRLESSAAVLHGALLGLALQYQLDPDGVDIDAAFDSLLAMVEALSAPPESNGATAKAKDVAAPATRRRK